MLMELASDLQFKSVLEYKGFNYIIQIDQPQYIENHNT